MSPQSLVLGLLLQCLYNSLLQYPRYQAARVYHSPILIANTPAGETTCNPLNTTKLKPPPVFHFAISPYLPYFVFLHNNLITLPSIYYSCRDSKQHAVSALKHASSMEVTCIRYIHYEPYTFVLPGLFSHLWPTSSSDDNVMLFYDYAGRKSPPPCIR